MSAALTYAAPEKKVPSGWESHWERCPANICADDPEGPEGMALRTWYADEPICTSVKAKGILWWRTQRKIRRLVSRGFDVPGIFTFAMLNRRLVVRPGICGLDPELNDPDAERRWISAHLGLSDAQREALAERGRRASKSLKLAEVRRS